MKWKQVLRVAAPAVGLLAALLVLMLWLAGAFRDKTAPGPPAAALAPADGGRVAVVRKEIQDHLEQVGTVRARHRALVASKVLAQVIEVRVEAGAQVEGPSSVHSGTVVARLDARDLRARLSRTLAEASASQRAIRVLEAEVTAARAQQAAVKARLSLAEADFRRYGPLVKKGVAKKEELDRVVATLGVAQADHVAARSRVLAARQQLARAKLQLEVAERSVEEARVLLDYTVLRAPFSGVVTEKLREQGDTVQPGEGVVQLEDPSQLELHAAVAESLAARLRLGQLLPVRIDALRKTFQGRVREIAPAADPESRTVRVKVTLARTPGLVSGVFGRLRIPVGSYETLLVPARAVRSVGQLRLVEVMGAETSARRFVTLGRRHGDQVEVRSGLREGEEVLLP